MSRYKKGFPCILAQSSMAKLIVGGLPATATHYLHKNTRVPARAMKRPIPNEITQEYCQAKRVEAKLNADMQAYYNSHVMPIAICWVGLSVLRNPTTPL